MDKNDQHSDEVASEQDSKQPSLVQEPVNSVLVRRRLKTFWLGVAFIVVAFVAGISGTTFYNSLRNENGYVSGPKNDGNTVVTKQESDIASVAEKVGPSVVSILTTSQSVSYRGSMEQDGAGTGIIVSKDGYVLTNKHVIEGATTVSVVASDGTTYDDAKVIGSDPLNDIAFVKINGASNLQPAELGDSTSVRIGQNVVAIGNALGQYQNSVTSGIISGTNRSVTAALGGDNADTETLTDLIQTDAAINPGNSGGPLVNMAGQVIGVNTAIASDANGIGFVIPISSARGILSGVLANGKVQRAYLGVKYLSITADVAKKYGLPVSSGAYIFDPNGGNAVVSGSPADKAGLEGKDIVTKVNDLTIGTKGSISSLIGQFKPGDTVQLTYVRNGQTKTTNVTLAYYKG